MSPEIRTLTEADLPDWARALNTGFLRPPDTTDEYARLLRSGMDIDRARGVFDAGRCVGTFRSFEQRLTAVGGASVTADAITHVTVSPTHRRRGLLSRMMDADLRLAKDRGDAVASLIAAEYPIYGRYGFGPATWVTNWRVEIARAHLDSRYSGPDDGARVDLVDGADVRELGPDVHERLRAERHGVIDRKARFWRLLTGEQRSPLSPWVEPFYALYRDADQRAQGLLVYRTDQVWEGKLPRNTATVDDLIATTPEAERALWRFLCSIDYVSTVDTGHRPPDDLLPLLLGEPRAARVTYSADHLWLRPLDVPELLQRRGYPVDDALVLEFHDAAGLAGGRYLLEAGPDGATCSVTTRPADLVMDIAELGTLWLGDESAVRLAALGRVSEERAGAAVRADSLLRAARRPWCPDTF